MALKELLVPKARKGIEAKMDHGVKEGSSVHLVQLDRRVSRELLEIWAFRDSKGPKGFSEQSGLLDIPDREAHRGHLE